MKNHIKSDIFDVFYSKLCEILKKLTFDRTNRTLRKKYLNRRGGAPSGAAAFIVIGGVRASAPINLRQSNQIILVR